MNNHLIMRSLPLVASVLGRRYGVKVEIGGSQAYTDGSTINLPSLPLDAPEEMLNLMRSYIDHESAHIRHSDFEVLKRTAISPLTMTVFNILEDWRVENALTKMYSGCRANFDWLIKFHFVHQLPIQNKDDVMLIADYILLSVRSWDVSDVAPNRDLVRKQVELQFATLLTKLDKLLKEARIFCDSTADCLDYACRIIQLIQDEMKNFTNKDDSTQDEIKDNNSNSSEGSSPEEGSQNGSEVGSSQAVENEGAGAKSLTQKTEAAKQLKRLLGATKDQLPGDIGESVGEMLQDASPNTNSGLTVAVETEKPSRALSKGDLSMVKRVTVALRSRLLSLMQTTTMQRRTPGRRGRLDTRKLYRVGHDARVFLKNGERNSIDTAVHILLDCSGSMRNRMDLASQSCFAVSDSLTHINGVSVGVTAFPANSAQQGKGGSTNRTVGTILKHGQRLHSEFAVNASGNTPLGEALWFVMQKMYTLAENRKLILIITDGEASNRANARQAINDGQVMGYEIYGIGIMDTHIEDLLPDTSRVIRDINELAPAMFNLLGSALTTTP